MIFDINFGQSFYEKDDIALFMNEDRLKQNKIRYDKRMFYFVSKNGYTASIIDMGYKKQRKRKMPNKDTDEIYEYFHVGDRHFIMSDYKTGSHNYATNLSMSEMLINVEFNLSDSIWITAYMHVSSGDSKKMCYYVQACEMVKDIFTCVDFEHVKVEKEESIKIDDSNFSSLRICIDGRKYLIKSKVQYLTLLTKEGDQNHFYAQIDDDDALYRVDIMHYDSTDINFFKDRPFKDWAYMYKNGYIYASSKKGKNLLIRISIRYEDSRYYRRSGINRYCLEENVKFIRDNIIRKIKIKACKEDIPQDIDIFSTNILFDEYKYTRHEEKIDRDKLESITKFITGNRLYYFPHDELYGTLNVESVKRFSKRAYISIDKLSALGIKYSRSYGNTDCPNAVLFERDGLYLEVQASNKYTDRKIVQFGKSDNYGFFNFWYSPSVRIREYDGLISEMNDEDHSIYYSIKKDFCNGFTISVTFKLHSGIIYKGNVIVYRDELYDYGYERYKKDEFYEKSLKLAVDFMRSICAYITIDIRYSINIKAEFGDLSLKLMNDNIKIISPDNFNSYVIESNVVKFDHDNTLSRNKFWDIGSTTIKSMIGNIFQYESADRYFNSSNKYIRDLYDDSVSFLLIRKDNISDKLEILKYVGNLTYLSFTFKSIKNSIWNNYKIMDALVLEGIAIAMSASVNVKWNPDLDCYSNEIFDLASSRYMLNKLDNTHHKQLIRDVMAISDMDTLKGYCRLYFEYRLKYGFTKLGNKYEINVKCNNPTSCIIPINNNSFYMETKLFEPINQSKFFCNFTKFEFVNKDDHDFARSRTFGIYTNIRYNLDQIFVDVPLDHDLIDNSSIDLEYRWYTVYLDLSIDDDVRVLKLSACIGKCDDSCDKLDEIWNNSLVKILDSITIDTRIRGSYSYV